VLILLAALAVPAAPATPELPLRMDARFSGFDIIAHVRRTQPALADRAEAISHWAGYYSVNPLLLARLVRERAAPDAAAVAALARALSAAAAPMMDREPAIRVDDAELARALGQALALPSATAEALVAATQADMSAAGLWRLQAVPADSPPALDLPFAPPLAWQFNGAHTWTGSDDGSPMSSLDFASSWSKDWGDDTSGDTVTAAHDGEVTVLSGCFVQVQHDGGWGTRYYHLDGVSVTTGARVQAGDPLGVYANQETQALCSGGHSTGPHLHFALLRDGQYASLDAVALSGYGVHPGDTSYDTSHDRMWLEKRGQRYYAFGPAIAQEPGDNTIDYRYNGMWYAPEHDGHGLNIEITETAAGDHSRKTVFVVMYTYDDAGAANFYVGNRDFDRWRSDESQVIDLLQTAGGDLAQLSPIDFDDPDQVTPAGRAVVRFLDCNQAQVELMLDERTSGQPVEHTLELIRLIGVPSHVCDAASLPLP
jgi:LasA protease